MNEDDPRERIQGHLTEIPDDMRIPWEGMTADEMRGAEKALDWLFISISKYGIATHTAHPDAMYLIIAEGQRANDAKMRRLAEMIP